MFLAWRQVHSLKYQYQYKYFSFKYKYKYQVLQHWESSACVSAETLNSDISS